MTSLTTATVATQQQTKRAADLAWLQQAEKSESERHAEYVNSDEYKAYQAGLLTWHTEQEKKKQAEEGQKQSDTWAAFREMEKESYTVPKEQSWWEKTGEWWNRKEERIKAGSDVLYNLSTAIGAVEIARHKNLHDKYVLSSARKIWEQGIVDSAKKRWGWDKVQKKMGLYVARTAKFIEQEITRPGRHIKTEMKAHWSSFSGQAKMTWDTFRRNGFDGLNVKPGKLLDFSGSAADIGSAIGYAGYAVTGNEGWKTAAQWADVASVPAAVRQVATNLKPAAEFFTNGPVSKGVGILGKVAGPLAIVTGGFTLVASIPEAFDNFEKGDNRMGWANTLSATSGGLAVAGGVFLIIPGGQPVAAVLLSASVITGVASLAVEYWPTPTGATTPVDTSLRPPTPPISTPIQTGTPTIPPTAVPTLTPTPPITSTPSPTPQVTQTPSPTQDVFGGE